MTKKGFENSVVSLASMTAGAMGSRIIADKLPIKNKKLARGILIATGIIGASALDRSSTGRKIGQDMALSMAVTQTGHLIKDVMEARLKENQKLHPALGNPYEDIDAPMLLDSSDFLSSYTPNYDTISEDVHFEEVEEFAG